MLSSGKLLANRFYHLKGVHAVSSKTLSTTTTRRATDANQLISECVQKTRVRFCDKLWADFKSRGWKRYRDAPADGITTDAEYFDNKSIVGSSGPTVLLIHGSPGAYDHFSPFISDLTDRGVRVVIPNQPTFALTRQVKHFRHSPEERLDFVKAILNEAGVSSIDLVAGHSSGTFTSLRTFSDVGCPTPKALALFNPIGYDLATTMPPEWLVRLMFKFSQKNCGRVIVEKLGSFIVSRTGNAMAANNWEVISLAAYCLHYNNRAHFKELIEDTTRADVPTLVILADNDPIMTKRTTRNLLSAFGTKLDDATVIGKGGKVEKPGSPNERIKVIRCLRGGHFSYLKYSAISSPALIDLLDRATRKNELQVPL